MRRPITQMMLVGLTTLCMFGIAVLLADRIPGVDVALPIALYWTCAWLLGAVFGGWNLRDSIRGSRATYRLERSTAATKAGGLWLLRSDFLQCSACLAMVAAGILAILQWSTVDVRTALILVGGLSIVINQVWNRLDRERVTRMPSVRDETRAMERLAAEIAASARRLGHDIANAINGPVGTLELLRARPGTTPEEAAEIGEAINTLVALADHVRTLHASIRASDPRLPRSESSDAP